MLYSSVSAKYVHILCFNSGVRISLAGIFNVSNIYIYIYDKVVKNNPLSFFSGKRWERKGEKNSSYKSARCINDEKHFCTTALASETTATTFFFFSSARHGCAGKARRGMRWTRAGMKR